MKEDRMGCNHEYESDGGKCIKCGLTVTETLSFDSELDEDFDIDIAIEDKGNCYRQKVKCEDCSLGKLIHEAVGKDRIDDLCDKDMVYFCARVAKVLNKYKTF
jgi:hypothetical protein